MVEENVLLIRAHDRKLAHHALRAGRGSDLQIGSHS